MKIYTICIWGHRQTTAPSAIHKTLKKETENIIRAKEYVDFLHWRGGDFYIPAA